MNWCPSCWHFGGDVNSLNLSDMVPTRIRSDLYSLARYELMLLGTFLSCDMPVRYFESPLGRALADNSGHVAIAVALWMACSRPFASISSGEWTQDTIVSFMRAQFSNAGFTSPLWLLDSLLCVATASLLDIDHFIEGGSTSLFDATHLSRRPLGHSVFFILFITVYVSGI